MMSLTMAALIVSMVGTIIASAAAVYAARRSNRSDSDARIDERIVLKFGERITGIETLLRELRDHAPSRDVQTQDSQRLLELERRSNQTDRNFDECFSRLRSLEQSCARNGHAS